MKSDSTQSDVSSSHTLSAPNPTSAEYELHQSQAPESSKLSHYASRLIVGIARHWLALFNLAWGLYIFLPFLAPVLLHLGFDGPARVIYSVYSFACHQLPDHSYFLFGDHLAPHLHELEVAGMDVSQGLFGQRLFRGTADFGFKVAVCQRDVAIYGSVLLAGILYGLRRRSLKPIGWKIYILLLIPMAVDGTTQLFGLRESNWWLRTLTGALFGMASVWLAYPHIEDAMQDVIEGETDRF